MRSRYNFRDEKEEVSQSTLQEQNALSKASRQHSMALRDVTRAWYCLLVLVVGLLILVTAEMFMTKEQRGSQSSKTVLFLRELCFQPHMNVTRLEDLAAQYIGSRDDSDPIQLDILSKSGKLWAIHEELCVVLR